MTKKLLTITLLALGVISCNKDLTSNKDIISNEDLTSLMLKENGIFKMSTKEGNMERFSEILSKATFERKDIREFLKNEALKQFDKDYNVLFYLVRNKEIGEKSFREILVDFSSEEEIASIEENVPLINILIPEISFFDISANNLDVNDNEIPVAISKEKTTDLYLNGKLELSLEKGEVPDFHVFVVRENSRVNVASINFNKKRYKRDLGNTENIEFLSPNFNGLNDVKSRFKRSAVIADGVELHYLVKDSYKYFNQDVSPKDQLKAYQRDYVYYGIKNKNSKGSLNLNVTDYIDYLEINPSIYFKFALHPKEKNNPYIKQNQVVHRRVTLNTDELISRMWENGSYEFKFEIFSDESSISSSVLIPLKPSEIWDFNIHHHRKHGTLFRRSKNTYTIDPNKFTSKVVRLNNRVPFAKWDISRGSLTRYVTIVEVNKESENSKEVTYKLNHVSEGKFSLGVKLGVGSKSETELGGSLSNKQEKEKYQKFTSSFSIKNDILAEAVNVYFYNPIINKIENNKYDLFNYSAGPVQFSVIPRIQ
ncbi:hypothetical protein J5U18_01470 [Sphingobacteriaceae bacterium WQ 2009]|uniref:Lipoprotein n=1 Tax=Rhinopithecimicrobium faecis TaxID=2820698 RepID=A0A8T4H813_9SPHI|nr:hypothetical protein [Sphingobacteriaceae bacterium WQ 2009]